MKNNTVFNRRLFMKTAGISTLMMAANSRYSFANGQSRGTLKSRYDFDKVYNRVGVNSVKWDSAINRYGKDKIIVPMGIADMDFKQFPAVTKALQKRAEYENYGYETVSDSYYQSIIEWNKEHYDQTIKKEWIRNSSGLTSAMVPALRGLNPTGGKVIVMTPTYNRFNLGIDRAGMSVVQSPMKKKNDHWQMDLVDLESRLDYETKCLILCNPNNPTGNCWTADELRALGDVCLRHGITILSDEIWCDILRKGQKYTPFASLGEKYANICVTYKSAGKTFNQAILKVAYFFTQNKELMNAIMNRGGHETEVNIFGQMATQVAYKEGAKWVDDLNEYIDANFDYLDDYINRPGEMPGVKFSKPQSTYLAWLDFNYIKDRIAPADTLKNGQSPEDKLSDWLVDNAGVQLNAGHVYGIGSDGFLRMNIAVPRAHLKLALDNLNKALKSLI
jgi:cysteine-S-conjugate beta-lyase